MAWFGGRRPGFMATWSVAGILLLAGLNLSATAGSSASASQALPDLRKIEQSFIQLADKVRPSVVAIETFTETANGDSIEQVPNSQGSGFVFRADGLIVTNHHVIEDADRVEARLASGQVYEAAVVQIDPRSDLAVLKIEATDLKAASLGDLEDVRQGQWAFTVGNPFGVANDDGKTAISYGIIEAIGRELTRYIKDARRNDRYYGDLLQTSASINPGNSGGPLFDIDGRVIGISTAMVSDSGVNEGLGFAIPISSRTRRLLDTLANGEVVRYGFLGVEVEPLRPRDFRARNLPNGRGAIINRLSNGPVESPAQRGGLRAMDVITRFDGVAIENVDHLIRVVGATPVGNEVEVEFNRGERPQKTKITLAERAVTAAGRRDDRSPEPQLRSMTWRGVELFEPSDAFLLTHGTTRSESGLYIHTVPEDSELYRYGVRDASLIMKLDGKRVSSLDEFREGLKQAKGDVRLELKGGETVVIPE